MKKGTRILIVPAMAAIILSGCAKSKTDNPSDPGHPLVKSMQMRLSETDFYTYTYYYDNENRLATLDLVAKIGSSTSHVQATSTYSDNLVEVVYRDATADTVVQSEVYSLNGAGQAIQYDLIVKGIYTTRSFFSYDAAGYLVRDSSVYQDFSAYSKVTSYTIISGNIAFKDVATVTGSSTVTSHTTYTLVTDKSYTTGNLNTGVNYMGKQNSNPVFASNTTPPPLTGPNPLEYTYEYDSNGRVTKATMNSGIVYSYIYQ
jgi:hypothetical protein